MRPPFAWFLLGLLTLTAPLAGCGTDQGPTLLNQKNVNGTYYFTATGKPEDPVMFTANMASGDPLAPTGANYYSPVTGTVTIGSTLNLGDCVGTSVNLSGKITNPDHNNIYINMTGDMPKSGTMTISGTVTNQIDAYSDFSGTIQIDGGVCPLAATAFVALPQSQPKQ